jgi:hypothetical protein
MNNAQIRIIMQVLWWLLFRSLNGTGFFYVERKEEKELLSNLNHEIQRLMP